MNILKVIIFISFLFFTFSEAVTVYENGTMNEWRERLAPKSFEIIYDPVSQSDVILFHGGGSAMLGAISGEDSWNNTDEKTISWKMRTNNRCTLYVYVNTSNGIRMLFYPAFSPNDGGTYHGTGTIGIHHGLGGAVSLDGQWHTFTRDLESDLHDGDPTLDLISVNGFIFAAGDNAMIDDIVLYNPTEKVFEDGEDEEVSGWSVSDTTPVGASINNLYNAPKESRVIDLRGEGLENQYQYDINVDTAHWNSEEYGLFQWKFQYSDEDFEVRINVLTSEGLRNLVYTMGYFHTDAQLGDWHRGIIEGGSAIHHTLGNRRIVGHVYEKPEINQPNIWHGVLRDLEEDIRHFEPNNQLMAINNISFRGSGFVDDIRTISRVKLTETHVYEDAEDGNTDGWHVYDNNPAGATISNVNDAQKGRVIELSGAGQQNGYEIGRRRNEGQWNNEEHKSIRWSMNFDEAFSVYVALDTSSGPRYMLYSATNANGGVSGNYIRIGLGANADNGTWQTFSRNLENDLHQYEPNNEIIAIDAFLVRGSGRIDDIETFNGDGGQNNNDPVYEDAEDGNTEGWTIFANDPAGATITNVEDADRGSRVIALNGSGKSNGYMLGSRGGAGAWNNQENSTLSWAMNYAEDFTIYISVETSNGRRYVTYTPRDDDRGLRGQYILLGLGADADNGTWQTFTRNIASDISSAEAGNQLISVNAFMIRGSGRVDDILGLE